MPGEVLGTTSENDSHQDDVMSFHVDVEKGEFYSGDYDGIIKKWNLSNLSLIQSWRAHPEGCPVYALVGNESSMFSSSCDGEIKEWDKKNGGFIQMTIVTSGGYDCECFFYGFMAKKLQQLRTSVGLPELNLPECYYVDNESQTVVLENLISKGFITKDKDVHGLTPQSVEKVMKELASFHATNYHFVKTYPEGLEKLLKDCPWFLSKTFFDTMGEQLTTMFTMKLKHIQELLSDVNRPDLAKVLEDQIKTWRKSFEDSRVSTEHCLFKTISHGDLWYSNMMFKLNEKGGQDACILIDYQTMKYSSPVSDLAYFFFSSTHPSAIKDNLKDWMEIYYKSLKKELATFGYFEDTVTFEGLMKDFDGLKYQGMIKGIVHTYFLLSGEGTEMAKATEALFKGTDENLTMEEKLNEMLKLFLDSAKNTPGYVNRMIDLIQLAIDEMIF